MAHMPGNGGLLSCKLQLNSRRPQLQRPLDDALATGADAGTYRNLGARLDKLRRKNRWVFLELPKGVIKEYTSGSKKKPYNV